VSHGFAKQFLLRQQSADSDFPVAFDPFLAVVSYHPDSVEISEYSQTSRLANES